MITLKRLLPLSILAGVAVQSANANPIRVERIDIEAYNINPSYSPMYGPTPPPSPTMPDPNGMIPSTMIPNTMPSFYPPCSQEIIPSTLGSEIQYLASRLGLSVQSMKISLSPYNPLMPNISPSMPIMNSSPIPMPPPAPEDSH